MSVIGFSLILGESGVFPFEKTGPVPGLPYQPLRLLWVVSYYIAPI
jgi:hypothetical protein